ncbi:biotin transporter BioY, partial [Staphylococcus aureus]|nr:biotin transporter BioY [Staphylococcus aureus]
VFLLLVVAGLPLLSGGRGGIGVFAGPSAGFLLLYPVVAFMIGTALLNHSQFRQIMGLK